LIRRVAAETADYAFGSNPPYAPSLRATGSRERAPDDRLREAIQSQGKTSRVALDRFVALLLAMTV
jgi:hypothetical protein